MRSRYYSYENHDYIGLGRWPVECRCRSITLTSTHYQTDLGIIAGIGVSQTQQADHPLNSGLYLSQGYADAVAGPFGLLVQAGKIAPCHADGVATEHLGFITRFNGSWTASIGLGLDISPYFTGSGQFDLWDLTDPTNPQRLVHQVLAYGYNPNDQTFSLFFPVTFRGQHQYQLDLWIGGSVDASSVETSGSASAYVLGFSTIPDMGSAAILLLLSLAVLGGLKRHGQSPG